MTRVSFLLLLCLCLMTFFFANASGVEKGDTWVVLACTSRFWFNYRHVANALSFYQVVRRLGVPDSQIVLMLADDIPCNARNARPGGVYHSTTHTIDLCANGLEVDYKNEEVTVENFVRVLTGRHPPGWPISKRLGSGNTSRVFIYMTGHGGDEFLKFHNHEEISSEDLAHTLQDMKTAGRYQDLFFVVDTCQGGTLFRRFRTPGVLAVGSSGQGENSFAHQNDMVLGVALVDRFTDASCQYLHKLADRATAPQLSSPLGLLSQVPLSMLLGSYNPVQLKSTPVLRSDLFEFEASREDEAEEVGDLGNHRGAATGTDSRLAQTAVTHFFGQEERLRVVSILEAAKDEEIESVGSRNTCSRTVEAIPVRLSQAHIDTLSTSPANHFEASYDRNSIMLSLLSLAMCAMNLRMCRIE